MTWSDGHTPSRKAPAMPARPEHRCEAMPASLGIRWLDHPLNGDPCWVVEDGGRPLLAGFPLCPWCGARLERPEPPIAVEATREEWGEFADYIWDPDQPVAARWWVRIHQALDAN